MQHKKLQKIPEKQENSKYNVLVHFVQKKNKMKLILIFSSLVSIVRLFGKMQFNVVT